MCINYKFFSPSPQILALSLVVSNNVDLATRMAQIERRGRERKRDEAQISKGELRLVVQLGAYGLVSIKTGD
jgi:hypothetical protein